MMTTIALPLAALAAATTPSEARPAPPVELDRQVLITSVSPEPDVGSGILATTIRVTGRIGDVERDYFLIFHESGQPRPALGATCEISFQRWDFDVIFVGKPGTARRGRLIQSYRCDGRETVLSGLGAPFGML